MNTTTPRTALFGPYAVDLRSGELRKHGTKLKMGEQPFQILLVLLRNLGAIGDTGRAPGQSLAARHLC